jgi:hypothetical protein
MKDSELSSSQLRARYAVETNSFKKGGMRHSFFICMFSGNTFMIYALVAGIIVLAYILKVIYSV